MAVKVINRSIDIIFPSNTPGKPDWVFTHDERTGRWYNAQHGFNCGTGQPMPTQVLINGDHPVFRALHALLEELRKNAKLEDSSGA